MALNVLKTTQDVRPLDSSPSSEDRPDSTLPPSTEATDSTQPVS